MKTDRPAQRLLPELIKTQKDIETALDAQERFIGAFQTLVQGGETPARILNGLFYPAAIFDRGGFLLGVNHALRRETDLKDGAPVKKANFLNRVTNENYSLMEAAESVFLGKTTLVSKLSRPLALFCESEDFAAGDSFGSALLFPVRDGGGAILFGTVMLLK